MRKRLMDWPWIGYSDSLSRLSSLLWRLVSLATSKYFSRVYFVHLSLLLLLTSLFLYFPSLLHPREALNMNGLPRCVNSDLPKNEFIRNLVHLPTSELLQHRLALFREACNKSLVSPDYVNLQLEKTLPSNLPLLN